MVQGLAILIAAVVVLVNLVVDLLYLADRSADRLREASRERDVARNAGGRPRAPRARRRRFRRSSCSRFDRPRRVVVCASPGPDRAARSERAGPADQDHRARAASTGSAPTTSDGTSSRA